MSEISKERAQEIFLGNGPEPTASEEWELARIALDWLALRERAEPVRQLENLEHFIAFWRKVQSGAMSPSKNEINYTVWFLEGLADIAAPPAPVVPVDDQARQAYENHVRSRYQYPMLERHPEDGRPWHGEYKESARQMEWEDWLHSWNACRAAMLATPGKEG
ncbi:hypothetical protein ACLE0P_000195 [Cronobacter sakazakii]|uniref:hypothetical protein n=1 Tax=Cronobacter sakazakii TaxID=28141 RepID=UPI000CFB0FAA|nr:hypothetical protein [Cronobacter sakazakii]EKK3995787.1 hypothetical protein [Cronobacter sakazakii]ELY2475623.1 hypothetical protein [Cronobacter sakazakii]ELY2668208.1 hypothetical protein [Cronobacter sakazakii]ELY4716288.1 hypothetical protein [Cronobacter sakazakii]ELY4736532.1 hypothetical protein [Cronobacter sakazakii]